MASALDLSIVLEPRHLVSAESIIWLLENKLLASGIVLGLEEVLQF